MLSISFGIGVVVLPILMFFVGRYDLEYAVYAWCLSSIIMFMISGFFFSRVFKLSIAEMFSPVWSSLVAVAIMVVVLVLVRIGLYRLKWSSISVFATVVSLGALIHLLAIVLLNRRLVSGCIIFMKKMF